MCIISLNIRGLGTTPKYLALKNLLLSLHPLIILIQEMMHNVPHAIEYFRKMFPTWHITAIAAMGLSGSLVALWDPRWINMKDFKCFVGILLEGNIHGMLGYVHILNIYAPYRERGEFWDIFISPSIMELQTLIIAGDLNCIISLDETWGCFRKTDPLAGKIQNATIMNNFVDIHLYKISPTWDNGRSSSAMWKKDWIDS